MIVTVLRRSTDERFEIPIQDLWKFPFSSRGTTLKYIENGNSRVFCEYGAYPVRAWSHDRSLWPVTSRYLRNDGRNNNRDKSPEASTHMTQSPQINARAHVPKLEYCQLLTRLDREITIARSHGRIVASSSSSSSASHMAFDLPVGRALTRTRVYVNNTRKISSLHKSLAPQLPRA